MEMEEAKAEAKAKTPGIELDWDRLLPSHDNQPPATLIVEPSRSTNDSATQLPRNSDSDMAFDRPYPPDYSLECLTDRQLRDSIRSKKWTLECMSGKLPDGGAKLEAILKRHEEELERRKMRLPEKDVDESEKPGQAASLNTVGLSNDLRQQNMSSQATSRSSFASHFFKKMEEDRTDLTTAKAFNKELPLFKHCNNQKMKENGDFARRGRKRDRSISRQWPLQCASNLSKHDIFNDDKRPTATSAFSLQNIKKNLSECFPKTKDAFQATRLKDSRSRKPIVLDDDDELQIVEKTEQEDEVAEYLKEAKIYYPSSDDPDSVEIYYTDIDCLATECYLTSTIMNFYIRYLQQQASLLNRSISDYHFFNTYFYKKLKEAVSYKKSDKEALFLKFRRWWKGVNIFEKAYVLIPIHEDLHWSLVIICIPDKEDESGPIILHLDSLGFHSSKSVFDNMRSYLREEWNYLREQCVSSDIPISDRIWNNLSRRLEHEIITVPQQKNEYDCGLFVLYFIERFIEEAPRRLKKKDLAMFGKQWFKPEEASSLRVKIRNLLKELFENSCKHNCSSECAPLSYSVAATECV